MSASLSEVMQSLSRNAMQISCHAFANSAVALRFGLIVTSTSVPGGKGTPPTETWPSAWTVVEVSKSSMAVLFALFHCGRSRILKPDLGAQPGNPVTATGYVLYPHSLKHCCHSR